MPREGRRADIVDGAEIAQIERVALVPTEDGVRAIRDATEQEQIHAILATQAVIAGAAMDLVAITPTRIDDNVAPATAQDIKRTAADQRVSQVAADQCIARRSGGRWRAPRRSRYALPRQRRRR